MRGHFYSLDGGADRILDWFRLPTFFFQLINARYARGAMTLTSNRSFSEWGEIFGAPVVAATLLVEQPPFEPDIVA